MNVPEPVSTSFPNVRLRRHAEFQLVYKNSRKHYSKEISFFFATRTPEQGCGAGSLLSGSEATTALRLSPPFGTEVTPNDSPQPQVSPQPHDSPKPNDDPTPQNDPAHDRGPRIGLTVGKVLGKAHDRNRIKRRLRSAIRLQAGLLAGVPVDVVLHPRRTVLTLEWARLEAEIAQIFRTVHKLLRSGAQSAVPESPEGAKAQRSQKRNGRTAAVSAPKPGAPLQPGSKSGHSRQAQSRPARTPSPAQ